MSPLGGADDEDTESTVIGRVDRTVVRVEAEHLDDREVVRGDDVDGEGVFEIDMPLRDGPVVLRALDGEGREVSRAIVDSLRSEDGVVYAPRFDDESRLEAAVLDELRELELPLTIDTVDLREQIGSRLVEHVQEIHVKQRQTVVRTLALVVADRQLSQADLGELLSPDAGWQDVIEARHEPSQRLNEGLFNGDGFELLHRVFSEDVAINLEHLGYDVHEQFDLEFNATRQTHATMLRLRNQWPELYEQLVIQVGIPQARSFTRSIYASVRDAGASDAELTALRGLTEQLMLDLRLAHEDAESAAAFDAFRIELLNGEGRAAFMNLIEPSELDEDLIAKTLLFVTRNGAETFDERLRAELHDDMDVEERAAILRELYGDLRLDIELQLAEELPELTYDPALTDVLGRLAAVWAPNRTVRPLPLLQRMD